MELLVKCLLISALNVSTFISKFPLKLPFKRALCILSSNMSQKFSAPNDEWQNYIAQMIMYGRSLSKEILNKEMSGSLSDLEKIQGLIMCGKIESENTQAHDALGFIFGKIFIENNTGYDWWFVEDEYGVAACMRYKETSLVFFPQDMIGRRIEEGQSFNVLELFDQLKNDLEEIRTSNYKDA